MNADAANLGPAPVLPMAEKAISLDLGKPPKPVSKAGLKAQSQSFPAVTALDALPSQSSAPAIMNGAGRLLRAIYLTPAYTSKHKHDVGRLWHAIDVTIT